MSKCGSKFVTLGLLQMAQISVKKIKLINEHVFKSLYHSKAAQLQSTGTTTDHIVFGFFSTVCYTLVQHCFSV